MGTDIDTTSSLNGRETLYIRYISDGIESSAAAVKAGYSDANAAETGSRLLRLPHIQLALHLEMRRRIVRLGGMAIGVLETLAKTAISEKVRLEATNSILNRAGLIPPRATADKSGAETPLHEMSVTELRRMADRLEGEIQARAKPVNAPGSAPLDANALDLID